MQRYEDFNLIKKGVLEQIKLNGLMKIKELIERINNKGDDLDLYSYEIIYNN